MSEKFNVTESAPVWVHGAVWLAPLYVMLETKAPFKWEYFIPSAVTSIAICIVNHLQTRAGLNAICSTVTQTYKTKTDSSRNDKALADLNAKYDKLSLQVVQILDHIDPDHDHSQEDQQEV